MIKCLFFAQLMDVAQCDSIEVAHQPDMTAQDLLAKFSQSLPAALVDSLQSDGVMVSVNKVLASWDHALKDGDEVAFLPPFSGG